MIMEKEVFLRRLEKVYDRMKSLGTDCMLITPGPDMKYLTGYSMGADERFLAAVFTPGQNPFIIANKLYKGPLGEIPCQEVLYWEDGQDPYELLARELAKREVPTGQMAVDDTATAGLLVPVLHRFPGSRLRLSSEILGELRMYKDSCEARAMKTACEMASEALRITMENGRRWIGHTEQEIAFALCHEMSKQGLAFGSASVSSQESSAEPHHISSGKVIEDNTCMWIDFGSIYENYNTDLTRTFYFGEPDPEYLKIHGIVDQARRAGIQAAKAGNPLGMVDQAARSVIESYGYGQYFTHRTGHGIGIKNHEGPGPGPGETAVIAPGMAFTVEPGIYLPGKFGVRIEDQLLVDEDGNTQVLHSYPPDLKVFR